MTAQVAADLREFYAFVGQQLTNGGARLSPEEVLVLWRERLRTIESVNAGLDDVASGRTKSLEEFASSFEHRHGIDRDA